MHNAEASGNKSVISSCIIRVMTKIGRVNIEGKNLNIDFFTNEEMKVTGIIHGIQYITGK
jgi:hypothetical protein